MAWYDDTSKKAVVREYKSKRDMERDIQKAAEHGWAVASVADLSQRSGCLRFLTLGIFTLFFKPKSKILVTYSRAN